MRFQYAEAGWSVEVDEFSNVEMLTPGWWTGSSSSGTEVTVVEPGEFEPAHNGVRVRVRIGKAKIVMSLAQADEIRKALDDYAQSCQHDAES